MVHESMAEDMAVGSAAVAVGAKVRHLAPRVAARVFKAVENKWTRGHPWHPLGMRRGVWACGMECAAEQAELTPPGCLALRIACLQGQHQLVADATCIAWVQSKLQLVRGGQRQRQGWSGLTCVTTWCGVGGAWHLQGRRHGPAAASHACW